MTGDPRAPSPARRRLARRLSWRKVTVLALLLALLALLAYTAYYFTQNKKMPGLAVASAGAQLVPPDFLYAISGTAGNELGRPIGVALSRDERLFVSDDTLHKIMVFSKDGRFLSSFDAISDGKKKKLRDPVHLAFDAKGELYVSDRLLDAIYVFDANGRYLRKFVPRDKSITVKWGPLAVAFDSQDRLYVSDVGHTANHRILEFDPSGRKLAVWGKTAQVDLFTDSPGGFYFPNGIVVSRSGLVFVADGNNRRVQVFDKNGKWQYFISSSGVPRGIAIDGSNRLFVSDALAHQIDIYSLKGDKLATFGGGGSGPGQFEFPNDVTIDAAGHIYIADRENHQVQVWGWPQAAAVTLPAVIAQHWGWCLTPLLLLPLLLLLRKRRFVVTSDFVDAMAASGDVPLMTGRRLRWIVPVDEHARYVGRVEGGVDLGELIEGEEHSESDAKELAERMEVDMPTAILLTMAQRAKRLATQDDRLRKLALVVGVDVLDRDEFVQRYPGARSSKP